MEPILYQCVVCQLCVISTNDLHSHHTENHTLEELSRAIIKLRGFKCIRLNYNHFLTDHTDHTDPVGDHDYCNTTAYTDNFDHVVDRVNNVQQPVNFEETTNYVVPKADIGDTEEFKIWERELSKNIAINEEDFLQCVIGLCNDLTNKNHKVHKKKGNLKKRTTMSTGNKENICVSIKEEISSMVGKDSGESCTLHSADMVKSETIDILYNTISGDFSNATLLQINSTPDQHIKTEPLSVDANTTIVYQS